MRVFLLLINNNYMITNFSNFICEKIDLDTNIIWFEKSNKYIIINDLLKSLILNKIDSKQYPINEFSSEINDGLLWSSVPRGIKGNFFLKLITNYHFGDVNIFWKDISENAKIRVENFYNLTKN